MNEVVKRQFIAGASCPECRAQDRLQRVVRADGTVLVECRACDMSRPLADPPPPDAPAAAPVTWKPARGK